MKQLLCPAPEVHREPSPDRRLQVRPAGIRRGAFVRPSQGLPRLYFLCLRGGLSGIGGSLMVSCRKLRGTMASSGAEESCGLCDRVGGGLRWGSSGVTGGRVKICGQAAGLHLRGGPRQNSHGEVLGLRRHARAPGSAPLRSLPVTTRILYRFGILPHGSEIALCIRRGSFTIWSNRKAMDPQALHLNNYPTLPLQLTHPAIFVE